jgi:hypothetical protein
MRTIQRISLAVAILGLVLLTGENQADNPPAQDSGVDVLTRGPVHEAYASAVSVQPEPGPLAPKAPPAPIEELPPDQKPEGDNVQWIPGYWSWDDERTEFIWVSGFWRSPPPGRQWVPGTWHEINGQYQYTAGFWTEIQQADLSYLPPPPKPVDVGPQVPAPAANYQYAPGCWVYRETHYVWRPGFWYPYRPNWVYTPAHYSWTPYGYVFVDGYWDYPLRQRGLLFAPVAFNVAVYSQPAFVYRPTFVVYDDFLYGALFVRPGGGYVFGDYYDPRYRNLGYQSWVNVSVGVGARDPLFAYYSTANGRNWAVGIGGLYVERTNNVALRPARTLVQQNVVVNNITNNTTIVNNNTTVVNNVKNVTAVAPITNVNKTQVVNLTKVTPAQQQAAVAHATEIRQVSAQRAKLEAPPIGNSGAGKPGVLTQPRTMKLDLPKPPPAPPPNNTPPPLPIKSEKPVTVTQTPTGNTPPAKGTTPPPISNNPPPSKGTPPPPTGNTPPPPSGTNPPPSKGTPPPPAGNNPPPSKGTPPPTGNNPPPSGNNPPPSKGPPPPSGNNPPPSGNNPPPSKGTPPPSGNNPPPPPPKTNNPPPPPPPKSPPPPPPKSGSGKDKDKDKGGRQGHR